VSAEATVLVVCSANVCRSRLAEWEFRQVLPPQVSVFSRGANAVAGQPVCPVVAAEHPLQGTSVPLEDEDVAVADLILALDRACRSAVVHRLPTAAVRAFTLREAAALAPGVPSGFDDVRGLAAALHAKRGLRPMAGTDSIALPGGGWRRQRVKVDVRDVPDAHTSGRWALHSVLETMISSAVGVIAERLAEVAQGRGQEIPPPAW
jgi:protein-tyrosine phosphatase